MCHATSGWPNSLPSSAFKVSHLVFQRFYFIFEFCVSCVFERGFAPMWAQATWSSQERAGGSGAGVTGGCGQPSVLPRMILCKSSVACNHRGPLRFYWFWSLSFQMNFKLCCCCYRFSFSSLIKKKKKCWNLWASLDLQTEEAEMILGSFFAHLFHNRSAFFMNPFRLLCWFRTRFPSVLVLCWVFVFHFLMHICGVERWLFPLVVYHLPTWLAV